MFPLDKNVSGPHDHLFHDGKYDFLLLYEWKVNFQKEKKGYLSVHLSKEGKSKTIKVHRLIATHFIPNHYEISNNTKKIKKKKKNEKMKKQKKNTMK